MFTRITKNQQAFKQKKRSVHTFGNIHTDTLRDKGFKLICYLKK